MPTVILERGKNTGENEKETVDFDEILTYSMVIETYFSKTYSEVCI